MEFLIFDVSNLISVVSAAMTLEAGDVIITGTPGGVGGAWDLELSTKDGYRFEVEIERIGILINTIADG